MDIPKGIDDYIKESIDHSLGLPISEQTLELKLLAFEESQRRLRDRCRFLHSKMKEKDEVIERARTEATMNAQALKKFVEENQRLAAECANLLGQCQRWERECSLYDRDREALMDFGNEADERAKAAEIRVHELEEELGRLSEELQFYKHKFESHAVDSSAANTATEEYMLESVLSSLINEDGDASAHAFLEANNGHESCRKLLKMWDFLKPSTQKAISLAARVKTLEKDKEHLRVNLNKAEEEVNLLFEENKILDEENKRLLKQCHREKVGPASGGKRTSSASVKSNKRRSCLKMSSPIEKTIDFENLDSVRQPLSPLQLQYSSPECRMHKK